MSYDEKLSDAIGYGFMDEDGEFYSLYLSGAKPPYEFMDPESDTTLELFYFDEEESAEAYLYETKKHHPEHREFLDTLSVAPIPESFVSSGLFEPVLKFDW